MGDDGRDAVDEACRLLADYLARLEDLVAEPPAPAGGPAAMRARAATTPEPYGEAGRALMTALEGIRRLEASMRRDQLGHLGERRPMSEAHTAEALRMVARLASQLDNEQFALACKFLDRWIAGARAVHGIDEARRWRHLPRQAGEALPPRCPYCGTFYLMYDPDARRVVCSVQGCEDGNGDPPVARLGIGKDSRPVLLWADGKVEAAPDLEAAG